MLICATGLGTLQGRCIVNAICLMVGEDEFLQLAKELTLLLVLDQGRSWVWITGSGTGGD